MTVVVETGGWRFLLNASTKMNLKMPYRRGTRKWRQALTQRTRQQLRGKKRSRETESSELRQLRRDREGKGNHWVVIENPIVVFGTFNVENVSKCPSDRKETSFDVSWDSTPKPLFCHCIFKQFCVSEIIFNLIIDFCRLLFIVFFIADFSWLLCGPSLFWVKDSGSNRTAKS